MNANCVIVDANIAFKCIHAGGGDLRARIGPGQNPAFLRPREILTDHTIGGRRIHKTTKASRKATPKITAPQNASRHLVQIEYFVKNGDAVHQTKPTHNSGTDAAKPRNGPALLLACGSVS